MADKQPLPGGLTVTTGVEDGAVVLVAAGEIDADTSGKLREAVDDVVVDQVSVIIDLSGVTFIDSSGLSALLYAFKQAAERGGQLALRSPSASVRRLLELTGQTERFLTAGS